MAGEEAGVENNGSVRHRANRANARRSTGPRSAAGKTRSARNALRHGLAIPIHEMAELGPNLAPSSPGSPGSLREEDRTRA